MRRAAAAAASRRRGQGQGPGGGAAAGVLPVGSRWAGAKELLVGSKTTSTSLHSYAVL
jgi:hypothetical protein